LEEDGKPPSSVAGTRMYWAPVPDNSTQATENYLIELIFPRRSRLN
jgi:hypothetical protein